MAKRKKISSLHLQKIEKAQHRNDFIARIKQFCDEAFDPTVFPLIPSTKYNEIYAYRSRFKLSVAPGCTVTNAILKDPKFMIRTFKLKNIQVNMGRITELSLYDFFTIGTTVTAYATLLKDNEYANAPQLKKRLQPLIDFNESEGYHQAWSEFFSMAQLLGTVHSDLAHTLYTVTIEMKQELNGTLGLFFCITVHPMQTEKIQVMIDGSNRPVYKLGSFSPMQPTKLDYVSIDPTLLNLPAGKALDVYIQSHALDRLAERIDGVNPGFLQLCANLSLRNAKVCKNKKGHWLFEFHLLGKRVGYFKGDVIDGKIILRTFLFLTNNGTPEGERLHEHTGIMKEDKMYLTIDKFSSFMHSDIKTNERVKAIFIKAGCQSLFEIDKTVDFYQGEEKSLANLIENYLTRAA